MRGQRAVCNHLDEALLQRGAGGGGVRLNLFTRDPCEEGAASGAGDGGALLRLSAREVVGIGEDRVAGEGEGRDE